MNAYLKISALVISLTLLLGLTASTVSAEDVTATLENASTTSHVVLTVSANGVYKINVEGNNPADVIEATASGGRLEFDLEGKTSWQIQNVTPEDTSDVWEMTTPDGWFGLATAPAPADDRSNWQSHMDYPCGMWEWDGEVWTWVGDKTADVCQSEWHLTWMHAGDKFVFVVPVAWESAMINAVWGNLEGPSDFEWTGVYIDTEVKTGSYTWTSPDYPNVGFRAKPKPQPNAVGTVDDTSSADPIVVEKARLPWWIWPAIIILVILLIGVGAGFTWLFTRRKP